MKETCRRMKEHRHMVGLLKINCYAMCNNQVVDARRCIKYDVLDAWYRDIFVKATLENEHERLVFNVDETEVNRKAHFKSKSAWKGKKRRGGHVSMLIMISGNELVKPSFLLYYAGPEPFFSQPSPFDNDIVYIIKTANGYMEKWTF